jgi:SAM-dependent methyltransferase
MTKSRKGPAPFDFDAKDNQGYRYTTNAPLSSIVANQRLTNITVSWIKKQRGIKSVMDLGCGDGAYTAQLAKACPRVKFSGTDPARDAIRVAKKIYPDISFGVADLLKPRSLPQPAPEAGIIRGVIHHVPDARQGVINSVRYSRKLLMIEPNGWNPILKVIEKVSPYHRAHGERSFTSQKLTGWVREGGSIVTKTSFVGLVPFFCPSWLAKFLKRIEPAVENSFLAPLVCAQTILEIQRPRQ